MAQDDLGTTNTDGAAEYFARVYNASVQGSNTDHLNKHDPQAHIQVSYDDMLFII